MSALLTELKVRARLRLNARRDADPGLRLRDCLGLVAREVGFANWEQARKVLGGEAAPGDDMGTFWHAPRCSGLLNPWFSKLAEARAALAAATDDGPPGGTAGLAVLLPYRRQFVLAGEDFLRELGLDPHDGAWASAQHDLTQAYGGGAWQALALARLKAPPTTFAKVR